MELNSQPALIYLITSGATTVRTTPADPEFRRVLRLVKAAVAAGIDLIQIREKNLTAAVLHQLAIDAARITRDKSTKLLLNDRADIAAASGADGVHLTSTSLPTRVVRETFGAQFSIGVSSHTVAEAVSARDDGADFVVFGPVFKTASKLKYGQPQGVEKLAAVTATLSPFPVLALGGVTLDNAGDCMRAGARGVAAISLLDDPGTVAGIVGALRRNFRS